MPRAALPLFPSRLDAGEALFLSRGADPPQPADAVLVVASDAAVEVAWPWAYLGGLPTVRVHPGRPVPATSLRGRAVILVDDGALPPRVLGQVLRRLRAAGPRSLAVAAPTLAPAAVRASLDAGVPTVRTLQPPRRAPGASRLYRQQPVRPRVAADLLRAITTDRRDQAGGSS